MSWKHELSFRKQRTRLIGLLMAYLLALAVNPAGASAQSDPYAQRLEAMGFEEFEVLERNPGWVVAKWRAPRTGLFKFAQVHDIPFHETALLLTGEAEVGRASKPVLDGRVVANMRASSTIRKALCNAPGRCFGRMQVYHYFLAYAGTDKRVDYTTVERPAFVTDLKAESGVPFIDRFYLDTSNGVFPDTPYRYCVADRFTGTDDSIEQVIDACGGDNEFDILKDRGIAYARRVKSVPDYDIYVVDKAEQNGTNTFYSFEGLFLESTQPNDAMLITQSIIDELGKLGTEVDLKLTSSASLKAYFSPKSVLHPLFRTSYESLGKTYMHQSEPPFIETYLNWDAGKGVRDLDKGWKIQQIMSRNLTVDDVVQKLGRQMATRNAQAESKRPTYTDQQKYDLKVANARKLAAHYGYLYFDDAFFGREARPASSVTTHTGLEYYLNGNYDPGISHRLRADYRTLLLTYVYTFNEKCAASHDGFLWPYKITTTSQTYDGYGRPVGSLRTVGEREVRIQRDVKDVWEDVFDEEEDGIGRYQRAGQGMSALMDIFSGRSGFANALDFAEEPARQVKWLFDNQGCDSSAVTQLKENLVRAARQQPSVQSARLKFDGSPAKAGAQPVAELLYEDYVAGLAKVTYVYGNTPNGWLPEEPEEMLAQARRHYGITQNHHISGEVPLMIAIVNAQPEFSSLSAMRYHVIGVIEPESRKMDDIGFKLNTVNHERSLSPNENTQLAVRKHFSSFVEANEGKLLVECDYGGGRSILYWHQPMTGVTPDMWRAVHPQHPLAEVRAPMKACPAAYR